MEHNREERTEENRFIDRNKSQSGKKAWKRHHASFMQGVRERERNMENKTFYGVTKELEEVLDEAKILQQGDISKEFQTTFEFIAGGVAAKLDKATGKISISVALGETGSGAYALQQPNNEQLQQIFTGLREDLQNICNRFDEEVQQVVAKYGLKSTI